MTMIIYHQVGRRLFYSIIKKNRVFVRKIFVRFITVQRHLLIIKTTTIIAKKVLIFCAIIKNRSVRVRHLGRLANTNKTKIFFK